ncbi:MAG TPA: flagellar M-ring protein FliF C-terminal domain-containing protein [Phycisphaerae bacterium]|nr:flagellar M-ring protein FliF C-terminal domain-containing protein [Phycisphaerae bacterium]HNU46153.1 flagellar M-ring protein FliF C-terminal domain-containing protein [Phycisphaerae bacterium]
MERLRQLINHIVTQLGVLSVSQRIAIALCAALVVVAVLWLMQWSAEPDMVPLVTTDFSLEQLQAAEEALKSNGAKYSVHGSRVYVRAADKDNLIRVLHQAKALPEDALYDLAAHVTDSNPFLAPEARKTQEVYALGNELGKIIATSPLIERARVVINPVTKRTLGREGNVPTASVLVTLAPGKEMSQETVEWLAKFVGGAVTGLKPYNVFISDARTGRAFSVPHPDDALGVSYLAEVKKRENHLLSKVHDALAYIPGVRATVSVELDTRKRTAEQYTYDKPQPRKEMVNETQTNAGSGASETGVQANVGTALTGNPAGQTSSTEKSETENFPGNLTKTERIEDQTLATKTVTATVSIPRSFVVNLFKLKNPDVAAPTDEDIATERTDQVKQVTAVVERIVMASPGSVQVDVFPDMNWDGKSGPGWGDAGATLVMGEATQGQQAVDLVRAYGPQAGLGVLALMSMFMMLRVVRRSSDMVKKLKPLAEAGEDDGEDMLKVGPAPVGQAIASESLLMGKEVDDETLRYQQLGEEVSKMVEDDPTGAADLIRRWVQEQD